MDEIWGSFKEKQTKELSDTSSLKDTAMEDWRVVEVVIGNEHKKCRISK